MLSTNRFNLKPITAEQLPQIFEGLSDPKVTKYYAVHFNTLEETKEQIEWYKNLREHKKGEWWAIYNKDHAFYGAIGFNNFNKNEKQIEIGFWLLPKFWKQGVISECLPTVIYYAFDHFKIEYIVAYVESENNTSSKLLEKQNFIKAKKILNAEIKNGKSIDLDVLKLQKLPN